MNDAQKAFAEAMIDQKAAPVVRHTIRSMTASFGSLHDAADTLSRIGYDGNFGYQRTQEPMGHKIAVKNKDIDAWCAQQSLDESMEAAGQQRRDAAEQGEELKAQGRALHHIETLLTEHPLCNRHGRPMDEIGARPHLVLEEVLDEIYEKNHRCMSEEAHTKLLEIGLDAIGDESRGMSVNGLVDLLVRAVERKEEMLDEVHGFIRKARHELAKNVWPPDELRGGHRILRDLDIDPVICSLSSPGDVPYLLDQASMRIRQLESDENAVEMYKIRDILDPKAEFKDGSLEALAKHVMSKLKQSCKNMNRVIGTLNGHSIRTTINDVVANVDTIDPVDGVESILDDLEKSFDFHERDAKYWQTLVATMRNVPFWGEKIDENPTATDVMRVFDNVREKLDVLTDGAAKWADLMCALDGVELWSRDTTVDAVMDTFEALAGQASASSEVATKIQDIATTNLLCGDSHSTDFYLRRIADSLQEAAWERSELTHKGLEHAKFGGQAEIVGGMRDEFLNLDNFNKWCQEILGEAYRSKYNPPHDELRRVGQKIVQQLQFAQDFKANAPMMLRDPKNKLHEAWQVATTNLSAETDKASTYRRMYSELRDALMEKFPVSVDRELTEPVTMDELNELKGQILSLPPLDVDDALFDRLRRTITRLRRAHDAGRADNQELQYELEACRLELQALDGAEQAYRTHYVELINQLMEIDEVLADKIDRDEHPAASDNEHHVVLGHLKGVNGLSTFGGWDPSTRQRWRDGASAEGIFVESEVNLWCFQRGIEDWVSFDHNGKQVDLYLQEEFLGCYNTLSRTFKVTDDPSVTDDTAKELIAFLEDL